MRASFTVEASFITPFIFLLSVAMAVLLMDLRDQICIDTCMQKKCEECAHQVQRGQTCEENWEVNWIQDLDKRLWVCGVSSLNGRCEGRQYELTYKLSRRMLGGLERKCKVVHPVTSPVKQIYLYEIFMEGE